MPSRRDAPTATVGLAWLATAVALCVVALAWQVEDSYRRWYRISPFRQVVDGVAELGDSRRVLLAVGLLTAVPAVWLLRTHASAGRLGVRCVGATLACLGAGGLMASIVGQVLLEVGVSRVPSHFPPDYGSFWFSCLPFLLSTVLLFLGSLVRWLARASRSTVGARAARMVRP